MLKGLFNRFKIGFIAAGALALVGVGFAIAQTPSLFLTTLTGNEQITVVEPSTGTVPTNPQILTITANLLRNSTGYQLTSATSGTVTTTTATDNLIFTAAAGTVTVNLPPSPADGELFSLNNGTSSNFTGTITVATTDGSTIANGTTAVNLGSAGSQEWQFTKPTTTWYRLR